MPEKINMKKGKTNNNVPKSNTLRSPTLVVSTLPIPTLGVSILTVFKTKPNNKIGNKIYIIKLLKPNKSNQPRYMDSGFVCYQYQ